MNTIIFDEILLNKLPSNAPRYTSYPTADKFINPYQLDKSLLLPLITNPISLYLHIPFCNTLCLFCACNKIITNKREQLDTYLLYLTKEIQCYYNYLPQKLIVNQLHFGGGSPSWLSKQHVDNIMAVLREYFTLLPDAEISMEIDPRHCDDDYLRHLKRNGFNRLSFGVQDFFYPTQKAVNRVQPYEQVAMLINAAKAINFNSISVDLIYGLPLQTLNSFTDTVNKIIELSPDRISLFNYAHVPSVASPQTRIIVDNLPTPAVKLQILQHSIELLTIADFLFIGMDHFAKRNDSLSIASQNGSLQRNFQGYAANANCNMLALGISAISSIDNIYYQNHKTLIDYYTNIDNNVLPIFRGIALCDDDIIRRFIIKELMCKLILDINVINTLFTIDFYSYFMNEIKQLVLLESYNLLIINNKQATIEVTVMGKFLIRNIAVVFDKYFNSISNNNQLQRYSRVI